VPDVYGPFDGSAFAQSPYYRDRGYMELSGVYGTAAVNPTPSVGDLPLSVAGMVSTLGLGRAHVRGAAYERTGTAWTYTHPANTSSVGPRIDRIVLRRDLGAKTVVPAVLQGAAAASPVAPALTQNEDAVWEMPLYQVLVPANSGTPVSINVDERYWLNPAGSGIGLGQNTPGVQIGQYRDHPTYGLQRWNGITWKKVPGVPTMLAGSENVGGAASVAPGGTGFVVTGSLSVPAHSPGTLLIEGVIDITPSAVGTPIAGFTQVGYGPNTSSLSLLGTRNRFHNNSNTWANYVPFTVLYDSDGTARVAAMLGWSDPGSGANWSTLACTMRAWLL
jgi:hypothetical protein